MEDTLLFDALIILFLTACSAFFSGSETALTAVSRARMYHLISEGNRRAKLVMDLREKKELLIGTILLGNTLVNILSSAIATTVFIALFGDHWGPIYAAASMTVLILICGEVLPKTLAFERAEGFALAVAPMVNFLIKALLPITLTLKWVVDHLIKLLHLQKTKGGPNQFSGFDMLRGSIEMQAQEGSIVKQDLDMLSGILDLQEVPLEDIMIHRTQVELLSLDQPIESLVDHAIQSGHSRLPLYEGNPTNIVGVLHVKNLLRALRDHEALDSGALRALAHDPWFVPATTTLHEQLLAFRAQKQHFAFVVDEYGAWLGIVTLEDILEEIVGDIDDEHDHDANPDIVPQTDGSWLVTGSVTIRELNRALDWDLPDDDASTIAGLVIHEAGRIPQLGEIFMLPNAIRAKVRAKKGSQITQLRVHPPAPEATPKA